MTRARLHAKKEMFVKGSTAGAVLALIPAAILALAGLAQATSYVDELRRLYFGFARRVFRLLGDQGCRIL
jgi:hypothetical protein